MAPRLRRFRSGSLHHTCQCSGTPQKACPSPIVRCAIGAEEGRIFRFGLDGWQNEQALKAGFIWLKSSRLEDRAICDQHAPAVLVASMLNVALLSIQQCQHRFCTKVYSSGRLFLSSCFQLHFVGITLCAEPRRSARTQAWQNRGVDADLTHRARSCDRRCQSSVKKQAGAMLKRLIQNSFNKTNQIMPHEE